MCVCVCACECVCVCMCVSVRVCVCVYVLSAVGFLMRWRWPCMTAICLHQQQQHCSSSHSAYRLAHPGVDDAGRGVVRLVRVVGEATVHAHLA